MPGAAHGVVRTLLRIEGVVVLVAACLVYAKLEGGWWYFVLLFFTPDLSIAGYLAGARVGASAYNAIHSYVGATVLLTVGFFFTFPNVLLVGLIWYAHIGLDRALGYGLKYATGFKDTHLGRLG